jgi:PAS domain S-box-containing protein
LSLKPDPKQLQIKLKQAQQKIHQLEKELAQERQNNLNLRENLPFFEATFEQSIDGICILDQNRTIKFVNETFAKMHGFTREELIGQPNSILYTESQWNEQVIPARENVAKTNSFRGEMDHKRKDDSIFPTWMSITSLKDETNNIIGYVAITREISEEKTVQEKIIKQSQELGEDRQNLMALNTRLQFLEASVEQSIDGICVIDAQRNVKFANEAFAKMHGYTREELKDLNVSKLFTEKQMIEEVSYFREMLDKNDVFQGEIGHKRKDDSTFPTWMSITSLRDNNGNFMGYIGIVHDISKEKTLQQETVNQNLEIQYFKVISLISSIFINNIENLDENINNGLKTLAASLKCNFIGIYQHQYGIKNIQSELKWFFAESSFEVNLDKIGTLFEIPEFYKYAKDLPSEIYKQYDFSKIKLRNNEKKFRDLFGSVLLIPILLGRERFGTMVLNNGENWGFNTREIQLALSVSIIINLALKNQSNQRFLSNLFDGLSTIQIGVFIVEINENGELSNIYQNEFLANLDGKPVFNSGIHSLNEFFEDEDAIIAIKILQARLQGRELPQSYLVQMKTLNGPKPMQLLLGNGKMDEKSIILGFLLEPQVEPLKKINEIFEML